MAKPSMRGETHFRTVRYLGTPPPPPPQHRLASPYPHEHPGRVGVEPLKCQTARAAAHSPWEKRMVAQKLPFTLHRAHGSWFQTLPYLPTLIRYLIIMGTGISGINSKLPTWLVPTRRDTGPALTHDSTPNHHIFARMKDLSSQHHHHRGVLVSGGLDRRRLHCHAMPCYHETEEGRQAGIKVDSWRSFEGLRQIRHARYIPTRHSSSVGCEFVSCWLRCDMAVMEARRAFVYHRVCWVRSTGWR